MEGLSSSAPISYALHSQAPSTMSSVEGVGSQVNHVPVYVLYLKISWSHEATGLKAFGGMISIMKLV